MVATNAAVGNVPDDVKDMLLRKGTEESRANFFIALVCAALPLLAGATVVFARRLVVGILLTLVAAGGFAAVVFMYTRPLPSLEPKVAQVPGLELPSSSSTRRLSTWALIALTPEGLWVGGTKTPSLADALAHPDVQARNSGRLQLLVDRRVKFAALVDVLEAASAAGRHGVDLVVQGDNVVGLVDAPAAEGAKPLLLTLSIADDALRLGAVGGALDPLPRDWRALNDKLAEIKAVFPDVRTLRVTATPETPVGDLVAALDAAREREKKLLFDEQVVGRFSLPKVDDRPASPPVAQDPARGQVTGIEPGSGDGVDRDALARYVKARRPAIVACYEKALKRDAALKGKVVVQLDISTTGRATNIELTENTVGDGAVGTCIERVVRLWVFPFKPADAVRVSLPFNFSPAP
ncbi:MAG: AgmX/PglI C-terminal domain-containing protein [Myxococcaceae bacterium]|nr:AgmX/PglI C-terminal domain-containing protein [Myxococcaceae bacterium]